MVEIHAKGPQNEKHENWPNGGAVAGLWKCKLWAGIAHALFDLQLWNFYTHMRLLLLNNFVALTFRPPDIWIMWEPVQIYLVLGFLQNFLETFFIWTLDRYLTQNNQLLFLRANENWMFMRNLFLPLKSTCKVAISRQFGLQYGRGLVQISLKEILYWLAKGGRYSNRF